MAPRTPSATAPPRAKAARSKKAPDKQQPAKKQPAKKQPAKKQPAKKGKAPDKKAPTKKHEPPSKKAPSKKAPTKKHEPPSKKAPSRKADQKAPTKKHKAPSKKADQKASTKKHKAPDKKASLDKDRAKKAPSEKRESPVDGYIGRLPGWQRRAARELRAIVQSAAPSASESLKWGQPVWEQDGPLAYLQAYARHVNLGFWRGTELADPHRLLRGTGGKMRHVKVREGDAIPASELRGMVQEALRLNRRQGTPTGHGS